MSTSQKNDFDINDIATVYSVCASRGLSQTECRMMVFVHLKNAVNGQTNLCEQKDFSAEIEALEFMTRGDTSGSPGLASHRAGIDPDLYSLPAGIKNIDAEARECNGTEFYLQSELHATLRFYKDPNYREKICTLYRTAIAPALKRHW